MSGHKNIEITREYIYIEKSLYKGAINDEFHTKVATKQEEIIQLLDAGFDYIMTKDELTYFRKGNKQWITEKLKGLSRCHCTSRR